MTCVAIELSTPSVCQLGEVVDALRGWQHDSSPMQLHPGDLGWAWRDGAEVVAAALRIWRRNDQIVAVAIVDSPEVLQMTVSAGCTPLPERFDRTRNADHARRA